MVRMTVFEDDSIGLSPRDPSRLESFRQARESVDFSTEQLRTGIQ